MNARGREGGEGRSGRENTRAIKVILGWPPGSRREAFLLRLERPRAYAMELASR